MFIAISENAIISEDLSMLSTNSVGDKGIIWDLNSEEPIETISLNSEEGTQVFISPDRTLKIIASSKGIKVFQMSDSKLLHTIPEGKFKKVLAISKTGNKIIGYSEKDGTEYLAISNIDGTSMVYLPSAFNGNVISENGDRIGVSGSEEGSFNYYVPTGERSSLKVKGKNTYMGKLYGISANYMVMRTNTINDYVALMSTSGKIIVEDIFSFAGADYGGFKIDFSSDEKYMVAYADMMKHSSVYIGPSLVVYDVKKGKKLYENKTDSNNWGLPMILKDNKSFVILFNDYDKQGAALVYYDLMSGEKSKTISLQDGPASTSYLDPAEESKKRQEAIEAERKYQESLKTVHCVGYRFEKSPNSDYKIVIKYTGIVSFRTARNASHLGPDVICKCGDKELLRREIQILQNTAEKENGILIPDPGLISSWD